MTSSGWCFMYLFPFLTIENDGLAGSANALADYWQQDEKSVADAKT